MDEAVPFGAVLALRRARRRKALEATRIWDKLYAAYLVVLVGTLVSVPISELVAGDPLVGTQLDDVETRGPAVLGLLCAAGIGIGLRSGARGGPLNLERPTVHYELLAPVSRARVLRGPALQQLRHFTFVGFGVGALAGLIAARILPVNPYGMVASGATAAALAAASAHAAALTASGFGLARLVADVLAAVVVGLSLFDVAADEAISPTTPFGKLALAELAGDWWVIVAAAIPTLLVAVGLAKLDGLSLEAAQRRSGLVTQLRFAAVLQDIRTVVLLRRELASEQVRATPWIRLPPSKRASVGRRVMRGALRFPPDRLARLVVLGLVAGLAVDVSAGVPVVLAVAAIAVLVAGYDAVEAVGQEVDHPTLWGSYPARRPGLLLVRLLLAGTLVMIPVGALVAVTALALGEWSTERVTVLALTGLGAALGGATGAALSTAIGPPDFASMGAAPYPEVAGAALTTRIAAPIIVAGAGLVPALALSDEVGWQIDPSEAAILLAVLGTLVLCLALVPIAWARPRRV